MVTGTPKLRLADVGDTLTPEEARRVLGLGRNGVYAGIKRGDIPSVRIGRRILVPKAGIEQLLRGGSAD